MSSPPSGSPVICSTLSGVRRVLQASRHLRLLPWIGRDAFHVKQTIARKQALLVTTHSYFYKIGHGPGHTIEREYGNYRQLASCCSELTPHLPVVQYSVRCHRPVLKMNRIHFAKLDHVTHQHAHTALGLLRQKGLAGTPADWTSFSYLKIGVLRVQAFLAPRLRLKLERILDNASRRSFRIGPVFGDFHHENLLSVDAQQFFLIDPTCFMPTGIQAYDALHYIAYWAWKTSGKGWSYWMDVAVDCQQSDWALPGCERIARDFIDVSLSCAGVVYATSRIGQLSLLFGAGWQMPERQKAGLSALVDLCKDD